MDAAYKISALSEETTGFLTLNFDWLYWALFAMNGVEMFTPDMEKAAFNTPETVALVKRLAKATVDGAINKISWTGRWREPNSAFASGTVGLYQAHGGAYYNFRSMGDWINQDTVGAAEFPEGWGVLNSHGFLVSSGSRHPDLAWEFVKQITNDKWSLGTAQRIIRTTGNKNTDLGAARIPGPGGPHRPGYHDRPGRQPGQVDRHLEIALGRQDQGGFLAGPAERPARRERSPAGPRRRGTQS